MVLFVERKKQTFTSHYSSWDFCRGYMKHVPVSGLDGHIDVYKSFK